MILGLIDAIGRMRKVRKIIGFNGGGVYKRIDENRELLELLTEKAPDLLASHPWVVCMRSTNDAPQSKVAERVRCGSDAGQRRSAGIFQGSNAS